MSPETMQNLFSPFEGKAPAKLPAVGRGSDSDFRFLRRSLFSKAAKLPPRAGGLDRAQSSWSDCLGFVLPQ
jgi:hypothetical protein